MIFRDSVKISKCSVDYELTWDKGFSAYLKSYSFNSILIIENTCIKL